jgi:MFS family permease
MTFRLSAGMLLAFSVTCFAMLREEVTRSAARVNVLGDIAEAFRNGQLVMVFTCLFLAQAAIQVTQPTLVLYIDRLSDGRNSTLFSGVVYSIAGLGTVAGATFAARRNENGAGLDRLGHESLFLMGLLGSAAFSALQGVWVAIVPLAAFRLLLGAFNGILTVHGNVLAATAVSREFRGRAFGVMSGVLPFGSVTGPLIGGIVGEGLGLGSAFYASSLLFLVSGGVLAVFRRRPAAQRQAAG